MTKTEERPSDPETQSATAPARQLHPLKTATPAVIARCRSQHTAPLKNGVGLLNVFGVPKVSDPAIKCVGTDQGSLGYVAACPAGK